MATTSRGQNAQKGAQMAHSAGMLNKQTPNQVVGHGCDVEATDGISENACNARMVS
jgi:hypothetical protein